MGPMKYQLIQNYLDVVVIFRDLICRAGLSGARRLQRNPKIPTFKGKGSVALHILQIELRNYSCQVVPGLVHFGDIAVVLPHLKALVPLGRGPHELHIAKLIHSGLHSPAVTPKEGDVMPLPAEPQIFESRREPCGVNRGLPLMRRVDPYDPHRWREILERNFTENVAETVGGDDDLLHARWEMAKGKEVAPRDDRMVKYCREVAEAAGEPLGHPAVHSCDSVEVDVLDCRWQPVEGEDPDCVGAQPVDDK